MVRQTEQQIYTTEQYLSFEVNSQQRHDYIDGEIVPVTGGTPNHNKIAGNLYTLIRFGLKGQPYDVFITDQRLWIPQFTIYTYPDVMVVTRPLQFQTGRNDTITNPILIAEVLSQTTKHYDKDEKFAAYRSIPSFQEYLLVDQYRIQVEHYRKNKTREWLFREYQRLEESLTLASVNLEIQLTDLYEDINFN